MEEVAGSTPASSTNWFTKKGGTAGINPSLDRADFLLEMEVESSCKIIILRKLKSGGRNTGKKRNFTDQT
jgi:hypothetical protein